MNLLDGTIMTTYPPGLKPWDGRFYKEDRAADVVVLVLSADGRDANEYAFDFYDDDDKGAFRVVGRRHRYLVSPKRGRWAPFAVPFETRPIVPCRVIEAAAKAYAADRKALFEQVLAAEQKQVRRGAAGARRARKP